MKGVHKSPTLYGAFPTDAYSHTPAGKGAQQPGMTGQVKEDILSRFGELGVFIKEGVLHFNPCLLRKDEFLTKSKSFEYVNVHFEHKTIELTENSLGFTFCQIPVVYQLSDNSNIEIFDNQGNSKTINQLTLDAKTSQDVFSRNGVIDKLIVNVVATNLK